LSPADESRSDGPSSTRHRKPATETVTSYGNILAMGKYRRGGYVFITWKGDHPPRHVHVYRDGKLIVKWDLDNQKPMKGAATSRILSLIAELEAEGLL
jgi:hypothetical protein